MEKRILLTGGTGFIGGFLAEEAVKRGYKIIAAIRPNSDTTYLDSLKNIEKVVFPFEDVEQIQKILEDHQIDFILNNAGLTRSKSEKQMNTVNAQYLKNIVEAATHTNQVIRRLLHISSLAAYGPADFTSTGIVSEEVTPHPVTMYGRSKLLGEKYLKAQNKQPFVIIRPTAVFGPREKDLFTLFKMINSGIQTKVGFKDQKLTFIYVKDLVQYIINALEMGPDNEAYFISDGNFYSSHQFNELIREALKKKTFQLSIPEPIIIALGHISEWWGKLTNTYPPLNVDKVAEIKAKSWVCDTTKNVNLGYSPKYTLEDGIRETTAWYKNSGWLD